MSERSRKLEVKRRIGRVWRALRGRADGPVVLLYHSVGKRPWAVPTSAFEAQIGHVANKYLFTGLDEALALASDGDLKRTVAITFDDGYACLLYEAAPVLSKFGAHAVAYLNTGSIGETSGLVSDPALGHYPGEVFLHWDEVEELVRQRWMIGSHGVDHVDLTQLSVEAIAAQLRASRQTIRALGLGECLHFAYPWGRSSPLVRRLVAEAGYEAAAGTVHGPLTGAFDRYALPRINIDRNWCFDDFVAVLNGDWDYLSWLQRAHGSL